MNKAQAEEAVKWRDEYNKLLKVSNDHYETCKHWSFDDTSKTQNSHPEFPDVKAYHCEWCGKWIKENELIR